MYLWRSAHLFVTLALLVLSVSGCGGGSRGTVPSPTGSDPAAGDLAPSTVVTRSDVVTPESGGSVVDDEGTGVHVPPGAVTADTPITVAVAQQVPPPPDGRGAAGRVYAFGPTGVDFLKPVTVNLAGAAGSGAWRVYHYDPEAGSWQAVEGSSVDVATGAAQAPVSRFRGYYAVAQGRPGSSDTTSPTVSLVAPAAGASVSGVVAVHSEASDNVGVVRVAFGVDFERAAVREAPPYTFDWDTGRVRPGAHRLTVSAFDAAGNGATASISVTVEVTEPAGHGSLSGRVVDADGRPVAAAHVAASGPTAAEGATDGEGRFAFENLPAGAYAVRAGKDGYAAARQEVRVEAGQTTRVELRLVPLGDRQAPTVHFVSPPRGATVSGQVAVSVEAGDNVGVVRVDFYLDGRHVAADETAPYSFGWDTTAVVDGEHRLGAAARDAAGNTGEAGIAVVVRNGAEAHGGRIAGKVLGPTGAPLAAAEVRITAGPAGVGRAQGTTAEGTFAFEELAAGTYTLVASRTGYQHATRDGVRVGAGATTEVVFTLQTDGGPSPVQHGAIAGVVRNAEEQALAGVTISVIGGPDRVGARAITDAHGAYRVGDLAPGADYVVRATKEGFRPGVQEGARVSAGETTTVNFRLQAETPQPQHGAIAGGVVTAEARPLPGAVVTVVRGPSGAGRTATTNASGEYRLAELAAGEGYVLSAAKEGYVTQTRDGIRVAADETTTVSFELRAHAVATGAIEGVVVNGEGHPIAGATVGIAAGPSGVGRRATTGERGGFRFGELTAGEGYVLKVSREGFNPATSEPLRVEAGKVTSVHIRLTR